MSDIISEQSAESLVVKERPSIWRRLLKNPSVVIGGFLIAVIAIVGPLAPLLTSLDPTEINPRGRNKPPGYETFIRDDDGNALPTGEIGRLLARACSNFGGYLKRPHLNATDADGWFDTGDLARVDDKGYIRITGRSKDVIIRGGENIPIVEIENLLYRHPSVAQVAIVAYPDERLGERACAVIVAKPDTSIDFDGMIEFLTSERVAKNYLPERLEVLDAMPTTPSGKIQKFKLRDMIVGA